MTVSEPPITYHLVPRDVWRKSASAETYLPAAFDQDGFIHCTDGADELMAVGNRYYRDDLSPYVVLELARARITSPVVYEDPGQIFPHIYGPLNVDAVDRVLEVERTAEGTFLRIGAPIDADDL